MAVETTVRFSRMAVRGLGGMFCLGLAMILTGGTCQASCGDYVVPKGSHLKMPLPIKTPCNSPACRGEVPPVPTLPAPVSSSPSEKPLALFGDSPHLEVGIPSHDWIATRAKPSSGFRSPLERPPSY